MRYAFFGSPIFAAAVLRKFIVNKLPPALVVCNPDRPVGRNKVITQPPTKEIALHNHIPVYQPERLSYDEFKSAAGDLDVAIVAAYGKIIPEKILSFPKHGTVGVHPSLLPRHRGPTPIQSAILNGDEESGVSIFLVDRAVDHGAVLGSTSIPIEHHDYETFELALAELGGDLLLKLLPGYLDGSTVPVAQDESKVTFTKKFASKDAFVSYESFALAESVGTDAVRLDRFVRALGREPGVWTYLPDGKRIKVLESAVSPDGKFIAKKIQREGKKPQEPEGLVFS